MPTLKYKDPVTGEYKSDIHVVGAVSSVNGKTGVVNLDNSDITEALGYTPADDQTAMEYYILTYDGSHFLHDGQQLTFTEIKNKCLDEKHFVYCQYNGDLYIPQHVLGAQIFFDATYIRNGNVEIHRISITPVGTATETVTTQEKLIAGSGVTIGEDGKTISATGAVSDVKVGSTSVLADGNATIKLFAGLGYNTNGLYVGNPSNINIDNRASNIAITAQAAPYAVKSALTTTKSIDPAWTPEEQAAARERIGVTDVTSQSITNALGYTPVQLTEIPSALSELTQDAAHRTVTDDEKTEWNASNREIVKIIDQMELAQKSKLNITGLSLDDVFVDVSIPFFEDAPYNIITIESGSKDVAYNVLSELKWPNDGTYYRRVASTCAIKIGDCRFIFCTAYKRTGVTNDIVVSSSGVGDMLTKITGKITGITSIYDFPQGTRVTVYGR